MMDVRRVSSLTWSLALTAAVVLLGIGLSLALQPPKVEARAPAANPSFAIVRIKLSPDTEADDWGIGIRGRNFWAVHVTTDELIEWAYGMNARQIEHAPDWLGTERYDVDGLPDTNVDLSREQYRTMLRAALADRFSFRLRPSEKILPVYVLSVADGRVATLKAVNQNGTPTWGVHRGWFLVHSMSFDDVARVMQRTIFDRPVLDQTGLHEKYSFTLRWRSDETQFSQMEGVEVPQEAGTEDIDDIYTAARHQLGLRIEAKKALAPTLVVESISRPSTN